MNTAAYISCFGIRYCAGVVLNVQTSYHELINVLEKFRSYPQNRSRVIVESAVSDMCLLSTDGSLDLRLSSHGTHHGPVTQNYTVKPLNVEENATPNAECRIIQKYTDQQYNGCGFYIADW